MNVFFFLYLILFCPLSTCIICVSSSRSKSSLLEFYLNYFPLDRSHYPVQRYAYEMSFGVIVQWRSNGGGEGNRSILLEDPII